MIRCQFIKSSKVLLLANVLFLAVITAQGCPAMSDFKQPEESLQSEGRDYSKAYLYFTLSQMKYNEGDLEEAVWLLERAVEYDPESAYLKMELANMLILRKAYDSALSIIQTLLSSQPDNIQALTMAGRIYQKKSDMAAAKSYFEKVLEKEPGDQNIYLLLGRLYWNENDLDNAERVFSQMVQQFPDSYAAHYFSGKVLSVQGKLTEAEAAYLKSLKLEPSLEEPRIELLKIYKDQNRPVKLGRIYREILAYNPDNHKIALELALHYRQTDQSQKALQVLKDLGGRSREEPSIITAVYENFLESKQYDTASWLLEGMLRGAEEGSDLNYFAGVSLDGKGQKAAALKYLLRVSPNSRFYDNAMIHGALLYHGMGKIDNAIRVIKTAITHSAKNVDFYLYLGSFYEEQDQYAKAADTLRQGLDRDASNSKLHFRLGVVYDKMGKKQASIAQMKEVVRLSPDNAEALNYLGYTYADLGINLDEAEALIQAALKIKPEDGYITDSLGWVYYKRGNYEKALRYLNMAVKIIPEDPVILEHLGDVHLKLNRPEQALEYYQRSLSMEPKDKKAIEEKIRKLKGAQKL